MDDEHLARKKLRTLLEREPEVEIIGECGSGAQAVSLIQEQAPDLLFLDVQMPGLDGFDVLKAVGAGQMPVVIFVTAYDQYALRAFEVHAIDYLLKPFDRDRFQTALERARTQIQGKQSHDLNQRLLDLLKGLKAGPKYPERLVVKSAGRVFFLKAEEIDWVEAADNYVRLHVGGEAHLLRETMSGLEANLDPAQFLRVHRSTIVNLERIKELKPWFHGEYLIIMRDGTQLTLSRSYRERLHELLGKSF